MTTVSTLLISSMYAPPFTIVPFFAAFPIIATIARGVPAATPHAPATTTTERVDVTSLVTRRVSSANPMANSTSQAASLSESFCIGAFLFSAYLLDELYDFAEHGFCPDLLGRTSINPDSSTLPA